MRCKHDSSATAAVSEVANAELSCYGVFRKLEPDGGDGGGGVEPSRVIAGRPPPRLPALPPPPTTTTTLPIAFSPQETASPYVTAIVAVDYDDDGYGHHRGVYGNYDDVYGDFDRDTFSVYDDYGGVCCDTVVAISSHGTAAAAASPNVTTTATTKTGPPPTATGRRRHRDDDVPNDFVAVVWDDYGCPPAAATGDLRGAVAGGAAAPFSHTPMGSTTKLVGIDANNDDTLKVNVIYHSFRWFLINSFFRFTSE